MKIKPLRDRIICSVLPVLNPSSIVGPLGEQWSKTDSMVRLYVVAAGPEVRDVEEGDICLLARDTLLRMMRTHKSDGDEYHLLHESDVDGVEECDEDE